MSRTMPTQCEHGEIVDWGDFGPCQGDCDHDDDCPNFPDCPDCMETRMTPEQTMAKVSPDIVTRLRGYREEYDNGTFCWSEPVPWMKEAADEIEALRAVVRTLRPGIYTSEITQPTLDFEPARMQVTPEELEAVRRALAGDIGSPEARS